MDDDTMMNASKVKGEATNKVKDGYVQLAEKVELVKNQVAKIERKYDELYQTVKAKDYNRSSTMISDSESREEAKSQRESIDDTTVVPKVQVVPEETVPTATTSELPETASPSSRKSSQVDFEKMENNPFL